MCSAGHFTSGRKRTERAESRGYRGQGRIMADSSGSGISEHGIAHFHNLLAQVFKDE
ncbi:hypothetical protein ACNKHU_08560 [Shigella flexneri]